MKRKKNLFNDFDDLLDHYYGHSKAIRKHHTSLSFDNVEVLPQVFPIEEYVVQASAAGAEELGEEYVVATSVDSGYGEPYTSASSVIEDQIPERRFGIILDLDTAASQSFYSGRPASQQREQDYQTSVLEPFAESKAMDDFHDSYNNENSFAPAQQPSRFNEPVTQYVTAKHNSSERGDTSQPPAQNISESASKEDEIINDLQAILSGAKVYDPKQKKTVGRDEIGKEMSTQTSQQNNSNGNNNSQPAENPHSIFDKIKLNMDYANAYNLGTIEVNTDEMKKKFADFERIEEIQKKAKPEAKKNKTSVFYPTKVEKAMEFDPGEFLADIDNIFKGKNPHQEDDRNIQSNQNYRPGQNNDSFNQFGQSGMMEIPDAAAIDIHSAAWPPRPTNIRPYTMAEKLHAFAQFQYEPNPTTFNGEGINILGNWEAANIVSVDIPQLTGKLFGARPIAHGSIRFHKLGADMLRRLWAAWEVAGLLDRVLSFQGGHAPRFIRGTQAHNPRPLSNHAWGTAFDINAGQNAFGAEPALLGETGCVRELVAIANQNGFFWGGHFGHKDGMHFELGKVS